MPFWSVPANAIRHAYAEAVKEQYKFYSYGDSMLII
jgi:S-adenosylmethionine:tRNA-ribosyltransferase-isomerase (queuine synthetase)